MCYSGWVPTKSTKPRLPSEPRSDSKKGIEKSKVCFFILCIVYDDVIQHHPAFLITLSVCLWMSNKTSTKYNRIELSSSAANQKFATSRMRLQSRIKTSCIGRIGRINKKSAEWMIQFQRSQASGCWPTCSERWIWKTFSNSRST